MDSTTPFRDPLPGALARRRELLSSRRDDFVEMPDSIRRTYVARWGRIGGGLAAALVASVFLGLIETQRLVPPLGAWLYGVAEELLPGKRPAVLATLLVSAFLAGGFAWILARALAERAFARITARAALPSDDVNRDIERLSHVTPAAIGRRHALRIEGSSVALPLLGLALLLPPAILYLGLAVDVGGYPREAAFEVHLLAGALGLAGMAAAGLILSLALRAGLRVWTTSRLGGVAGTVAAIGGVAGLTALMLGSGVAAVGLVGLVAAGAVALLMVRKERIALGLRDSGAAALDDSIGGSLGNAFAVVHAHLRRLAAAAAASAPVRGLRRVAATCRRSNVRRRSLVLAAAAFAAGAVVFSLRGPAPEKLPMPVELVAMQEATPVAQPETPPTIAGSPGASLRPEPATAAGGPVMAFRYPGPSARASWRALALPPIGTDQGWRVTVDATLLYPAAEGAPSIGLSAFSNQALQFGHTWRFSTECERSPVIEWRAMSDDATDGPDGVLIAWSTTIESCAPAHR